MLTYKCCDNSTAPVYLRHTALLSHSDPILKPSFVRSDFVKCSAPTVWNSLPASDINSDYRWGQR